MDFDVNILYDYIDLLVSDYSSATTDAIYKDVVTMEYCPDFSLFQNNDRGFVGNYNDYHVGNTVFNADELEDTIKKMFFSGDISFNEDVYITSTRHKELLGQAKESLQLVLNGIDNMISEDFLTIDLMTAYEKLGLIIGEEVEDDLADRIFSKFCMGK